MKVSTYILKERNGTYVTVGIRKDVFTGDEKSGEIQRVNKRENQYEEDNQENTSRQVKIT